MKRISILAMIASCLWTTGSPAIEQKANLFTGYELTLMPPTKGEPELFGWIRLVNGTKSAGFIYLQNGAPRDPALSFKKDYIITAMPVASLDTLLTILRGEKKMQIRYFDPQSAGLSPSVFLEPMADVAAATNGFKLDAERFAAMSALRARK